MAFGDQVIVTSQSGRGDVRPGNHPSLGQGGDFPEERSIGGASGEGVVFLVESFHRKDGRRLWQYRLPAERTADSLPEVHRKTNLANPSPATDGERVYAWFGTGQMVALDLKGKLVWQKHLAKEYGPYAITWGHSSSPTLYRDTLILQCDHEPASYLLALDKRTGKQVWKADRGKGLRSYSTPIVVPGPGGDELVVNSSLRLEGYDPKTGERLWFYEEPNQFPIHVPSFANGVIYASRGYRSGPYMAIRPGGRGDIKGSTNLLWHVPTGAPYVSSTVHYQGVVYLASDAGILQAADAETGKRLFQGRTGKPLLGGARRRRRQGLLRERERRDRGLEGIARVRDPGAKPARGPVPRLPGDLARPSPPPQRRRTHRRGGRREEGAVRAGELTRSLPSCRSTSMSSWWSPRSTSTPATSAAPAWPPGRSCTW